MRGILLKIASVLAFIVMAAFIKAAEGVPVGQLVFFRSFFAIVPVAIFLAVTGQLLSDLHTANPAGHVLRGLLGVVAMALIFFGLTRLPLPESTAIGYAAPLFIVVFSALLLKETVRLYRWSAVLIGLAGVAIIIWPRLTVFSASEVDTGLAVGAAAALAAAFIAAFAQIQVRVLVRTETSAAIVIYFSITASLLALLTIPWGWVWPTPAQAALLIGAGFLGGLGQILLTTAYRHAEMSVIAPFEYTSILLSIVIGYVIFGDVPTVQMLVGGVVVVGAGAFVLFRERQLGLTRADAALQ